MGYDSFVFLGGPVTFPAQGCWGSITTMYTVSSEWIKLSKLAASTEKSKAASELIGRWEGQQIQTIMYGNMELILALVLNTLKDFDPDELFFRLHIRALP